MTQFQIDDLRLSASSNDDEVGGRTLIGTCKLLIKCSKVNRRLFFEWRTTKSQG